MYKRLKADGRKFNFCRRRLSFAANLIILKMLFLTNEFAKKAAINILSVRDTTGPAYEAGGTIGSDTGVYKAEYSTWWSSWPQNQPRSFSPLKVFLCFVLQVSFIPNCH